MKIKNMAAVLLLIWTCGFSSVVSAAEIQTVQLTEENQLVYTKDKTDCLLYTSPSPRDRG